MIHVALFLFSVASAQHVVTCGSKKPCDPKHEYILAYNHADVKVNPVCMNEEPWFSKTKWVIGFGLNLKGVCKHEGFDGVGLIKRATPTNLAADSVTAEEDILCNVKYDVIRTDTKVDRVGYSDDHATWQCIKYQPAVECCTKWTAACYNTRGPYNNFVACNHEKLEGSACEFLCGLDMTSVACSNCCVQNMENASALEGEKPWKCSEDVTPEQICARNSGSKRDCKNALAKDEGKCKFKKGKGGDEGKCKLKYAFEECDALKKRDCKKAVKKGRCVYDDEKEKTCKKKEG